MSSIGHLITVADLENYPDDDGNRYELIEGELFVSRAPGVPHQLVLNHLIVELGNYLKQNPIGLVVPGAGAVFSNYDAVIPDLVYVSHERWDDVVANDRFVAAPNLVIEILSPGNVNRARDLEAKRGLYAKYGVEEYWVVDSENHSVMILRLKEKTLELFSTLRDKEQITSPALPQLSIEVGALFKLTT
jgi:Uma2 family endonuclease